LITDRRRRANRANAKSSTGPKTAPGKARSAQNALRHGLNVSVLSDPAFAPSVEAIALKIAGPDAGAGLLEGARRIAESQVDLNRVTSTTCWPCPNAAASFMLTLTTARRLLMAEMAEAEKARGLRAFR
jgi:hypothetical protein